MLLMAKKGIKMVRVRHWLQEPQELGKWVFSGVMKLKDAKEIIKSSHYKMASIWRDDEDAEFKENFNKIIVGDNIQCINCIKGFTSGLYYSVKRVDWEDKKIIYVNDEKIKSFKINEDFFYDNFVFLDRGDC